MPDERCELFGGASGKLVVLTLTGGAFVTYVGSFAAKKRYGLDSRTWEIFWLDLTKMGLGQFFATLINVLNAHRNSLSEFDPVSWYFPTFLNDELIAVPLGVLLWHQCLLRLAASARRRWYPHSVFLQALQASGRYYPAQSGDGAGSRRGSSSDGSSGAVQHPHDDASSCCGGGGSSSTCSCGGGGGVDGDARAALMATSTPPACGSVGETARCLGRRCTCCCGKGEPRLARYDWWLVQASMWVTCVLCSRLLGGLVVPAAAAALGDQSPYYMLAKVIHELDWTCDAKRWTFAGVLRIVIDVAQLAIVDWFNKFRTRGQRAGATAALASQEFPPRAVADQSADV
jgi:hypothetical protein